MFDEVEEYYKREVEKSDTKKSIFSI